MKKILVVGETCVDSFIYGVVERLSPEAPVPILKPTHVTSNSGMSGNVVSNLKSINAKLDITHLTNSEQIKKVRFIEGKSNHIFLRVDKGENKKLNQIDMNDLVDLDSYDSIIISDYDKGFLTSEIINFISSNNKKVFLDSKKDLTEIELSNLFLIKLNEDEYNNNKNIVDSNLAKFVITLGPKGAKHNNIIYESPKPQETIDVSGAGDTFIAALVSKYLDTDDISQSIEFANKMSSVVVSKRGVTTP
jgi:bifunctional ADP-heptose synthase (sugar kinase/adenylyltransferase)